MACEKHIEEKLTYIPYPKSADYKRRQILEIVDLYAADSIQTYTFVENPIS